MYIFNCLTIDMPISQSNFVSEWIKRIIFAFKTVVSSPFRKGFKAFFKDVLELLYNEGLPSKNNVCELDSIQFFKRCTPL